MVAQNPAEWQFLKNGNGANNFKLVAGKFQPFNVLQEISRPGVGGHDWEMC